jgi:type IV fimbrial biogenesis protein FimT
MNQSATMHRFAGFTLIEIMVALAIFAILLMLAGPQYAQFMANHQIRNATDALLNGVQQAQATAVRGNTLARLLVDTTAGTGGWQVLQTVEGAEPSPPNPVQVYKVADGAPQVTVATVPGDARQVTFDGFGRIVPNVDASATLTCFKVTHQTLTGSRQLNVAISNSGLGVGTKLCDPSVSAGDPAACPTGCQSQS